MDTVSTGVDGAEEDTQRACVGVDVAVVTPRWEARAGYCLVAAAAAAALVWLAQVLDNY